jgi:hypothetical protein
VAQAEPQRQSSPGDQIDRQSALRQLHRVLHPDREHPGGDLDAVDLAERHRHGGEQVGLVGQLRGPEPCEAPVPNLAEVVDVAVDEGVVAAVAEELEHADPHSIAVPAATVSVRSGSAIGRGDPHRGQSARR